MFFDSIIKEIDFSKYTPIGTQKELIPVEEGSNAAQTRQTNTLVYALMQEMWVMKEKMTVVPGVPQMLERVSEHSYADTPFIEAIADQEVPKKFSPPKMTPFEGASDPFEHVNHYKQHMIYASLPRDVRESCMCKG